MIGKGSQKRKNDMGFIILEFICKFIFGFVPGMLFASLLFRIQDRIQLYLDRKQELKALASEIEKVKKDGTI